jgi:hypothetical protein
MPEIGWRAKHPDLDAWAKRLEARPSVRLHATAGRLGDHAAAQADVSAVEHRRLPGRHRPLRLLEVELE